LLVFKCFLDVFGTAFKLLNIFGLGVATKLLLAGRVCNLEISRGLLPIFEDAIEAIHGLDVDAEVVNEN
jgi:hypothetical protein